LFSDLAPLPKRIVPLAVIVWPRPHRQTGLKLKYTNFTSNTSRFPLKCGGRLLLIGHWSQVRQEGGWGSRSRPTLKAGVGQWEAVCLSACPSISFSSLSSLSCTVVMSKPGSYSSQSYSPATRSGAPISQSTVDPKLDPKDQSAKTKEKDQMVGLNDKFVAFIDKVWDLLLLVVITLVMNN